MKLQGLAFLATVLAPVNSYAVLDESGHSPKTLFRDTCSYHGLNLTLECDLLKRGKEPMCTLVETRNGSGRVVNFPTNLSYPIVGVEIFPFQKIHYCIDPPAKEKEKNGNGPIAGLG